MYYNKEEYNDDSYEGEITDDDDIDLEEHKSNKKGDQSTNCNITVTNPISLKQVNAYF